MKKKSFAVKSDAWCCKHGDFTVISSSGALHDRIWYVCIEPLSFPILRIQPRDWIFLTIEADRWGIGDD